MYVCVSLCVRLCVSNYALKCQNSPMSGKRYTNRKGHGRFEVPLVASGKTVITLGYCPEVLSHERLY